MSSAPLEIGHQLPLRRAVVGGVQEQRQTDALNAELQAALAREAALLRERHDLSQREVLLAREFEHRLINGLQVIASLLSVQSRTAATPEAAAQLTVAAGQVAALGRVHHRLHLLDHKENVLIKKYFQHLCEDLSDLLFQGETDSAIVFDGVDAKIPTAFALPLGFIVSELTTNAAKYGGGSINVRLESTSSTHYLLSVLDKGPGLPKGFNPANSTGLGMTIVEALVKQIGGALHFRPGNYGIGTCISVAFALPRPENNGT